ncbi:MAG: putative bifunctional diguanylate cyclase/phosphodiesterase [Gammaproteobacteria bacterium]
MLVSLTSSLLGKNIRILRSHANKVAVQGVAVAVGSIVFATLLVSYYLKGEISATGIIEAQSTNFALWVLDVMPFVFGFWGQYSSSIIAYEAGVMVLDQTQELREKADNLEQQVNYTTTHDAVTDLPNRALFYDRVERAIAAASEQNKTLSILLLEIANFKEFYDTLGRTSSDIIVKQIATRLISIVSSPDSVGRIDGNIFAILLADIKTADDALQAAKNCLQIMEPAFPVERLKVTVEANIGIVQFPKHGDDVDSLVQKAGIALYMAGKSSKGYAIYQSSFDDNSPRQLTMMGELRRAIERNQLTLYYQPKISLHNHAVVGAEAVLRWRHPKHGLIMPDEFIPMAEKTRMIGVLTRWVIKKAFTDCKSFHDEGHDFHVSVNLSARDLHDHELSDLIIGLIGATGAKPEWIIFEITESSIMTDRERALETVNRLENMGFRFSIDDFGTGYSSLVYLKKMPIYELKIDRSFVMDMLANENDAVIVNATINLAHNLGIKATAEGVETKEVLDFLIEGGCDEVQGYFLSPALGFTELSDWVTNASWQYKRD